MSASVSATDSVKWSREEEKAFENAIAMHWADDDDNDDDDDDSSKEKWEKIASAVPAKIIEELKHHYQLLVDDVAAIEAGHIPLPNYVGEEAPSPSTKDHQQGGGFLPSDKRSNCNFGSGFSGLGQDSTGHGGKGGGGSRSDQERRKGIPWTEEEHR